MITDSLLRITTALFLAVSPLRAQATAPIAPATIASVIGAQIAGLERPFVAAAAAMPADAYNFTPTNGAFSGVRSFALEVKHVATANTTFYSAILGRPMPGGVSLAGAANGPDTLVTKDQILTYLRASFALAHEAVATISPDNATTPFESTPVPTMSNRLALAIFGVSHGWDHYGQMVEYLRMRGIVPPASQGQPPANPPRAP